MISRRNPGEHNLFIFRFFSTENVEDIHEEKNLSSECLRRFKEEFDAGRSWRRRSWRNFSIFSFSKKKVSFTTKNAFDELLQFKRGRFFLRNFVSAFPKIVDIVGEWRRRLIMDFSFTPFKDLSVAIPFSIMYMQTNKSLSVANNNNRWW